MGWYSRPQCGPCTMKSDTSDKIEKKRLTILGILKEAKEPLGSIKIMELMNHMRYDIRERTVRFHLQAMDAKGNLFATGPGGVHVFTPDGTALGRIDTGERIANVAWGNDGTVLYLTSDMYLCRVKTSTKGAGW